MDICVDETQSNIRQCYAIVHADDIQPISGHDFSQVDNSTETDDVFYLLDDTIKEGLSNRSIRPSDYAEVNDIALMRDIAPDISHDDFHPDEVADHLADLPTLPEDKSYHVMFSFSTEDRVWVRAVLEKLEARPYNLKCGISDRDFHPGMDVLNNIEILMSQSLNTAMVISPDHLQSHYCDYELNLAMEQAHQKKGKVIPILRSGEDIPSGLRFINYIDGREGISTDVVVSKIYQAVKDGLQMKSTMYTIMDPCVKNGESVQLPIERIKRKHFPTFLCRVPPISSLDRSHCVSLGIEVTELMLLMIISMFNRTSYVMLYRIFTNGGLAGVWLLSLVVSYLTCSIVLIPLSEEFLSRWLLSPLVSISFSVMVLICYGLIYREAKRSGLEVSGHLSKYTYRKKLLVVIGDENRGPYVQFIKYDVINCQEYIRQHLVDLDDTGQTDSNEVTRQIIELGLEKYPSVFVDSRFTATQIRHPVRKDKMCLCQFVEKEGLHIVGSKQKNKIKTVQQRSRNRIGTSDIQEEQQTLLSTSSNDIIIV